MIVQNDQSIVFGKKKTGLLKKEWVVEIVNSNPYVKTNKLGNYSLKDKRKKISLNIGISYGFNLKTEQMQPLIGLSLGYPIVSL